MKTYKNTFVAKPSVIIGGMTKENETSNVLGFAYVVKINPNTSKHTIVESISGENLNNLIDQENCWIYTHDYKGSMRDEFKDSFKVLENYEEKEIELEVPVPNDWVVLNDGSFLKKDYGKYRSNLIFINDVPELNFIDISYKEFNLDLIPRLTFIKGDYFVTKKGADAFRIKPDGNHLLLCDQWSGAFNSYSYRGGNSPNADECLYQRITSSNGSSFGNTFSIVEEGFKRSISIDDL